MSRKGGLRQGIARLGITCACWLGTAVAAAAPATPPSAAPAATTPAPAATDAAPAPAPDPEAQKKEEAKTRFLRGIELAKNDDLDGALVEFLAANEIYPTRVATLNAGRTLIALKRYVEATAMYELLLSKFGADMEASEQTAVKNTLTRLHEYIGELSFTSDQPGTTIVVDGQDRGATPLSGPIRINGGTHSVRAYKEGFVPYETQVMVAGGQQKSLTVSLKPLSRSGRLRVAEARGAVLDVVVDGVVVGKTPWEGVLSVGGHTVLLRGDQQMGTPPTSAELKENDTASLTLSAVKLDATVRVEPTPSNARVAVDGVSIGNGVWQGQVQSGQHKVEVFAPGFLGFSKDVLLKSGQTEVVQARLKRNPDDPIWGGFRPHVYVEAIAGGAIAPSFGGSADQSCSSGGCSSSTPPVGILAGARGGYELVRGLGVELFLGYLTLRETMTRTETAKADPHVQSLVSKDWDDATRINGPMAAISASYQMLDKTPLTFRVWAGAARVKATFGNGGTFKGVSKDPTNPGQTGTFSLHFDLEEQAPNLWVPFVGPEVRMGLRLSDSFTIDAGLAALFMFPAATPRKAYDGGPRAYPVGGSPGKYPDGTPIPQAGQVELPQENGFGTIVAFAPTIGARYDF
jgi:hypothetical protein